MGTMGKLGRSFLMLAAVAVACAPAAWAGETPALPAPPAGAADAPFATGAVPPPPPPPEDLTSVVLVEDITISDTRVVRVQDDEGMPEEGGEAPPTGNERPMAVPAPPPPDYEYGGEEVYESPPMPDPVAPVARPVDPCCPPTDCCQARDACGWPLDRCGEPYGRWEVTLYGTGTWINDIEGPFGEEAFTGNQMNWDGLDYGIEFGGGGAIQYAVGPRSRIRFEGAWLGQWDDSARTSGQFAFSPVVPGIAAANTATVSSEAELYTGELMWWQELTCVRSVRWDIGFGFRGAYFEETARADAFGTAFNPGFPVNPFVESTSENLFLGAQLGAAMHLDVSPCFEINAIAKGMVGNMNRQLRVDDRSIFAGGNHTATDEEDALTLGLEAEVSFRWRWTSRIALVGGYRLLVLDDIVRANDAMDFSKSTSGAVQARQEVDQLFSHTFFAGLNFNF